MAGMARNGDEEQVLRPGSTVIGERVHAGPDIDGRRG